MKKIRVNKRLVDYFYTWEFYPPWDRPMSKIETALFELDYYIRLLKKRQREMKKIEWKLNRDRNKLNKLYYRRD